MLEKFHLARALVHWQKSILSGDHLLWLQVVYLIDFDHISIRGYLHWIACLLRAVFSHSPNSAGLRGQI